MGKFTKTQKSQQLVGDQERESRRDPHANTRPRLRAEPRTPGRRPAGGRSSRSASQCRPPAAARRRTTGADEQDGDRWGTGGAAGPRVVEDRGGRREGGPVAG
jgi:hypothetical protein